ncbi:hypothetical protein [uncultured Gimesia sp.]|uniref:hypothetical protein n=1 Tax=uncultured Gimesia sp. TaxID=1678688 RepID=UPI00262A939C|nr:hypothetical protein [uncultured Gimesia sp.]
MGLSKERLITLLVVIANGILGVTIGNFSDNRLWEATFAVLMSLPGMIIIWKKEALSVTGLTRGLRRDSPPSLLDLIGWFFLLVMPVLYVYELSKH